jgi:alternate signal-mediated exported protein
MDNDKLLIEYTNKKKKKTKRALISTIIFECVTVLLFSAQTFAYFNQTINSDTNKIASGNLNVELIEMQSTQEGETVYMNPMEIMPATEVSKIVRVENAGDLPIYVRIKIEKTINKDESTLPDNWEDLISCNFKLDNNLTTDVKEGLWTYHNGYYYYILPIEAGSTSVPLFDVVSFSAEMGNEFINSEMHLTITCQATQANGNADNVIDAVGWPPEVEGASVETESVVNTEPKN